MKKNKALRSRIFVGAVLGLLLAAVLGMMVYDLIHGGRPEEWGIIRMVLLCTVTAFLLGRLTSGRRSHRENGEALYGDLIRGAFARDLPSRTALLSAIHRFQTRAYAQAERQLLALLPRCAGAEDLNAVEFFLGAVYTSEKRDGEALERYGSILRRAPGHAMARTNLGRILLRQGKTQEAEEAFSRARQEDKTLPYPCICLSSLRLEQGQPEQALAFAREALDRDPTQLHGMRLAALAARAMGDRESYAVYREMFADFGGDLRLLK